MGASCGPDSFPETRGIMTNWEIGPLPFVYTVQPAPGNAGFPEMLPFRLGLDEQDGFLIQIHDVAIEKVLDKVYACGSQLSGLMDEGGIGRRYADDFLAFIHDEIPRVKGCRVLDVGCGTGYLLSRLKAQGAEVLGLEPGAHGEAGAARYQVPIIRDVFPSAQAGGPYDLICAFCLLEHVRHPEFILRSMKSQLADEGWLVLAVPDCEPYLDAGDISFLFHEHWNYFTGRTLAGLVRRIFGKAPVVRRSGFGGCQYLAIQKAGLSGEGAGVGEGPRPAQAFEAFVERARASIQGIWTLIAGAWDAGETVGIYVPWRAVNVLALRPSTVSAGPLRFFDDNPLLCRTYYPGFPIPVESRAELLARPPDRLLILSNTFAEDIERQLHDGNLAIPIHTWRNLYGV